MVLAALLPAAAAAQPTELVLWTSYRQAERDALEKVVQAFNDAHPNLRVKVLAVPHDAYPDKISAAVPRGKGPDLFIYAQDRLGGWIEAGNTIEPLDFFVDDATLARFLPSTLDAMTYQGTLYGLPLNYKVLTMIYNKKIIDTPPKTSTELVALAKKHTDAASGRYGLVYWYSDFYQHSGLMNAFGGGVFDKNRNPTLDSPANIQSMKLVLKWLNQDKILPAEPSTALITALFNEGKAAIIFNGPWFLGEISKDIDYGLALLPKIDEAGGTPMKPWATVEGVFITATSQHKDAAYEFLTFITDTPQAKILALEGRQTPSNKKVYDDPAVKNDAILAAFAQQYQNAVPMPNLPEMSIFWSPATTAMNAIVKGAATPEVALEEAQAKVLKDVERLRGGS
jgi:arabinogalactan oligomer/maltooligosaccharide transport system substrate-binding protein